MLGGVLKLLKLFLELLISCLGELLFFGKLLDSHIELGLDLINLCLNGSDLSRQHISMLFG